MRTRTPKIINVKPACGFEGGRVLIEGSGFNPEESANTQVTFGGVPGRILLISNSRIIAQIPDEAQPGPLVVQVKNKSSNSYDFTLGHRVTGNVNPVDSPIFDREGNLYVTFSGKRGETVPVSVFKISPDGVVNPFLYNIPNATSLAMDSEQNLYISSRFEGTVYKATPKADVIVFAKDLGVPTGLAINADGYLFVGDRGGRVLKVSPAGEVSVFAEIPESNVAFHLTLDNEGNLLVSNPGLSSHNNILMIDPYGKVIPLYGGFGRPQGLTVDKSGNIYICEAKAGESAVLKIAVTGEISTLVTGSVMVGVALDHRGNVAVATPEAVYKIPLIAGNGR